MRSAIAGPHRSRNSLRCNPFRDIAIATEAPLVAILEQFRCKRRPVNVHHFHHALTAQLFNLTQLPTELLLEYDQNIVRRASDAGNNRESPTPKFSVAASLVLTKLSFSHSAEQLAAGALGETDPAREASTSGC